MIGDTDEGDAWEGAPTPDTQGAESRKRRFNGDTNVDDVKRFNIGDKGFSMKLLIPNAIAGAIIGKGGDTMKQLKRDTGGSIQMSKPNDFYPGTSDRICLISGDRDIILTVLDFVIEKIWEKSTEQTDEAEETIRVLVPDNTAGMIIGKSGNHIRFIKEQSGCSYVQVSHKTKEHNLPERCVNIVGRKDEMKAACEMVLEKIMEDPQSGSFRNVSYSEFNKPFNEQSRFNQPQNSLTSVINALQQGLGLNLSINLNSAGQNNTINSLTQLLDHIKQQLRNCGLTDLQVFEICAALTVLAKYGVLGVDFKLNQPNMSGFDQGSTSNARERILNAIDNILEECLGSSSNESHSGAQRFQFNNRNSMPQQRNKGNFYNNRNK